MVLDLSIVRLSIFLLFGSLHSGRRHLWLFFLEANLMFCDYPLSGGLGLLCHVPLRGLASGKGAVRLCCGCP